MAYWMTIHDNLTLSDGILNPIALTAPVDVRRALAEAGYVTARPTGLESLHEAWMYLRAWRYEATFDWPGDDERAQVGCAWIAGSGLILLNDHPVAHFAAGPVLADVTEALIEGENRLAIVLAPAGQPNGLIGLCQPLTLRSGNAMTLESFEATAGDAALSAESFLTVHTSGKFQFRYTVALADEAACKFDFTERLTPRPHRIAHALPIDAVVPYDPARPDQTTYAVRLDIERSGISCHKAYAAAARVVNPLPTRLCAVSPTWSGERLDVRLALLKALGVTGLKTVLPYDPALGFLPAPGVAGQLDANDIRVISEAAPLEIEALRALAADEKAWPPGTPVWRLTGSRAREAAEMEALFGLNAMGDAARATRLMRFLQAERIAEQALLARRDGATVELQDVFEDAPRYGGPALIEADGAARPAYDALQQAWAPVAVYVERPEGWSGKPGQTVMLPVWLMAEGLGGGPYNVTVTLFTLDGTKLAGASYAALPGGASLVGTLRGTLPTEPGVVIARAEVEDGGVMKAHADYALCVTDDEAPLRPLTLIKPAQLREAGGRLKNEGRDAALSVCAMGYRALLPGEDMPCGDTYECLNGL